MADGSGDAGPELQSEQLPMLLSLFKCQECYVYRVPPATTAGHRAELWDVNKWLATVQCEVVKRVEEDDAAFIRLLDPSTKELFAECPVPVDVPLVTAVEPVIDSSRYYVIRIVDQGSGRHAFIGLGFRDREESSDFNAALHEHLAYVRRKKEAEEMRKQYEQQQQQQHAETDGEGGSQTGPDYSMKPGETVKLKINVARQDDASSSGFVSAHKGKLTKTVSLMFAPDGSSVAALAPPPGSLKRVSGSQPLTPLGLSPSISPSHTAQDGSDSGTGGNDAHWGEYVG